MSARLPEPGFVELFTPKLLTVLREGYGLGELKRDALAGLTVAIVALPLSMAIAISCGLSPTHGLYASIVGGFLVSALGGSRFQIGGPAGAFIVLVAATVAQHGVGGMLVATMMAGVILIITGLLRLGTYVKFIPYPVTVGFTAGIAIIILAAQIKDLFGLTLTGPEPGELLPKLVALTEALPTANITAIAVSLVAILLIMAVQRWRPTWPAYLIAVAVPTVAVALLSLPVETIGSRFGAIPRALPGVSLPPLDVATILTLLPNALAFALLGAIESLLSAVVADGMTGRRHRSNCELVAQGIANVGSAITSGMVVTGTIARTATNVRAGAHGPVAGMLHALFLGIFLLVAAPVLQLVPLAALAGVLVIVAWNMAERHQFALLLRSSRGDALVLLVTFLFTIFQDLSFGITAGVAVGGILFITRAASSSGIDREMLPVDLADTKGEEREAYEPVAVPVYRMRGPFFFGVASAIGQVIDDAAKKHKAFVLDLFEVPFLDSTAARTLISAAMHARKRGVDLYISGAAPSIRRGLLTHGIREAHPHFRTTADEAISEIVEKGIKRNAGD
ncbi:MAG: SulP family inorganic anion transporter [Sphingomonadaceae bacterium]